MKKNKRLLYDIENISDKFLEEAEEDIVKKKSLWKLPVSVAACAAAVFAVPVILFNMKSGDDAAPLTNEANTESAVQTSVTETEILQDTEIQNELNDTNDDVFPEPFFKFYYLKLKNPDYIPSDDYREYSYNAENGTFKINFLKDKEFENQINKDIADLIASMPSDFKFPETAPSVFNVSNPNPEDFGYEEGESRELFIIPNVTNGYFSFMLAIRITDNQTGFERYEYARSFVYDLIEKKKIDTLNEFFGDDDSGTLVQNYCDKYEISGEITGFANYNIICSNEKESLFVPFDKTFAVENNVPFAVPRDFSEILDDDFAVEFAEESVVRWGTEHISYNGKDCSYDILESSSLYPDFWVEKHNSIKKAIMEDMLKLFVDNDIEMDYILSNESQLTDMILGRNETFKFYRNLYILSYPESTVYDADTLEKINISEIFTDEGIEYISELAAENNFADKDSFANMLNSGEIYMYYRKYTDANSVSLEFYCNNGDFSFIDALVPAEMMNSRYFDFDKYMSSEL